MLTARGLDRRFHQPLPEWTNGEGPQYPQFSDACQRGHVAAHPDPKGQIQPSLRAGVKQPEFPSPTDPKPTQGGFWKMSRVDGIRRRVAARASSAEEESAKVEKSHMGNLRLRTDPFSLLFPGHLDIRKRRKGNHSRPLGQ